MKKQYVKEGLPLNYSKNSIIKLRIGDMGTGGEGIGKLDGIPFFVKDAVIGDFVSAKVIKMKKNYGYARLMEIIKPSEFRVEPKCANYKKCGGCQLQPLSYDKQLELKEQKVLNNLKRIGGFPEVFMEPMVGMDDPFHYRNKAIYPFGKNKEGEIITGFYASRSHSIIPNRNCHLGVDVNEKILNIIVSFMEKFNIEPYQEQDQTGLIRNVLIRYGFYTKEIMVCLILNGKSLPQQDDLVLELCKLEGMTSISISVNEKNTNVILGEDIFFIWGQEYITDFIDGIQFRISPQSFYQVNPKQTENLYKTALKYAGLTGEETVWDLYCGIGTISLFLAQKAKQVYGVELIPQAIEDAKLNAEINDIRNASFLVGKAEEVLPDFYNSRQEEGKADVIVVDPPRKGCDQVLLDTIIKMAPDRVVYVSCDSATLARDLKFLCGNGYVLCKVRVVDMFSQTVHVETVALLTHKKDAETIDIEMEVDKEDVTEKATYKKIQDYVKEKHGLYVHTKYIAEVKRRHGIPMYDAPNKVEVPKRDYPPCPVDKVKAIDEALKYFSII